jgi:dTDP-4-dehydrorhamnose reductase
MNFDVNSLWVHNLAKLSAEHTIDFITISTDYVFDGSKKEWYTEDDVCNPINSYGMAKYLWEQLAQQENPDSIIIRTSRLYWWGKEYIERRDDKGDVELIPRYKNFVNTIINLWTNRDEVKVVNDQFGAPTYTIDLCEAIAKIIDNIEDYKWKILHFCNQTKDGGISWFEFAEEICKVAGISTKLTPCSSQEFVTKAPRPQCSKLINWSDMHLRSWEEWLHEYLTTLS